MLKKRIAARLRALAARLDPQPKPAPTTWFVRDDRNTYATSTAADAHIRFTHGGDTG